MLKALTPLACGSISVVGSEHSGFLCAFLKGAFQEGTEDPLSGGFAHMVGRLVGLWVRARDSGFPQRVTLHGLYFRHSTVVGFPGRVTQRNRAEPARPFLTRPAPLLPYSVS